MKISYISDLKYPQIKLWPIGIVAMVDLVFSKVQNLNAHQPAKPKPKSNGNPKPVWVSKAVYSGLGQTSEDGIKFWGLSRPRPIHWAIHFLYE